MSGSCSIRYAIVVALGLFAILWGQAWAQGDTADAAEVLEVKVLGAEAGQGQEGAGGVLYRMEVISVLSSSSGVQSGEVVRVRSSGAGGEVLELGWMGTAYVNSDPQASGAERQFVTAAGSGSLVKRPPGPPSATFTREAPKGGQ